MSEQPATPFPFGDLPEGTVTFLFSDIEGSTQLLYRLGDQFTAVLAEHHRMLREAVVHGGGQVVRTEGDSFFVAFPRATEAVAAAVEAQRALAQHSWPEGAPVRVRMGLHTGEPEVALDDYVGIAIHRAARIAHVGHGGQVLLSETTTALVQDELPSGVSLLDLGRHLLKDIRRPEHICQLAIEGLPAEFSSLKTLGVLPPEGARLPRPVGTCPYRGLAAFREADAPFYCGREGFVDLLEHAVRRQALTAVIVGSSGSGKSSALFAGLLPRLRKEGGWQFALLRPGTQPFYALAGALLPLLEGSLSETDRLAETRKLAERMRKGEVSLAQVVERIHEKSPETRQILLVVDQFEELYTLCADGKVQQAFIGELLAGAEAGRGRRPSPCVILLTLRADFMGQALAYRPLADALQEGSVLMGPMTREELHAAIEKPAEMQGAAFEAGLVERILDDVGDKPGNLPLLEFTLTLLWERQTDGWLTHGHYEAMGSVEGALATYADQVYGELDAPEQERARRALVQLVRPGEGTEDTRRVATREELGEESWKLIQHLADRRLVVTGRDAAGQETAEVVHEALIQRWGRFREWMDADRAFRAWQERLRGSLRQWQESGRDEGALLAGAPLLMAQNWLAERGSDLSPAEAGYIREGQAQQARRLKERERRRQQMVLALAAGLVVVAALGVIAFIASQRASRSADTAQMEANTRATAEAVAGQEREAAQQQARLATSRELANAATNNLAIDPERSTLLALQALKTADTLEARNALHQALPEMRILRSWVAHDNPVTAVTYSPDGELLASSSADRTTKIWDTQTGELLHTLQFEKETWDVVFSPDGKILATSSYTQVVGIDPQTGQQSFALKGKEVGWSTGYDLGASRVGFSPDGKRLAVANIDGHPVVWDLATQARILTLSGHKGIVRSIDFSPDGKLLATGSDDGTVRVWDAITAQQLFTPTQTTTSWFGVRFSPDGSRLAAVDEGSDLEVWDLGNGKELLSLARPEAGGFRALAWSPDGTAVVTAGYDGVTRMWDAASGQQLLTLPGHVSTVLDVKFSQDGKRLVSSGVDRTIKIWDPGLGRELLTVQADGVYVRVAYSPDGSQLATTGVSGTPKLWDAATGQLLRSLPGTDPPHVLMSVAYSRDGKLLAAGSLEGIVTLWDLERGQVALSWQGHGNTIAGIAFSPEGKRLATGSHDGMVKVWDVDTGQALTTFDAHARHASSPQMQMVLAVAFSPDGRRVASAGYDGAARVWDSRTGQETYSVSDGRAVFSAVGFSPDGELLAAGEFDGPLLIVDAATGAILHKCTGHSGAILDIRFSTDSRVVASASFDRLAKLWDAASGQEMASLYGNSKNAWSASFTPDGKRLAVGGWDGTARIFVTTLDELVGLAKSRLTRSLTTEECQKYLHVDECPAGP